MWDVLSSIIHIMVVAALSLVGVNLDAPKDDEARDNPRNETLFLTSAPTTAWPSTTAWTADSTIALTWTQDYGVHDRRVQNRWTLDIADAAVARFAGPEQQCDSKRDELRALIDLGVPVLLRPDEISS